MKDYLFAKTIRRVIRKEIIIKRIPPTFIRFFQTLYCTDEVWCVLDIENSNENATLTTAIEKAKKTKLNLAISNPSFEYWYFIHFESSSRPFLNGQEKEPSKPKSLITKKAWMSSRNLTILQLQL